MYYSSIDYDSQLVNNLSKGNILAFNILFRKYSQKLYLFALGYQKSKEDAEELVQEVFTIVWEKRENLKKELSFSSYLFTIAFNIIRRHFKARVHFTKYLNDFTVNKQELFYQEDVISNSLREHIRDLVDALSQRQKEVFIKSRFDGYSIKEISEELCISHKTVENHLTAALKYIRMKLTEESVNLLVIASIISFFFH